MASENGLARLLKRTSHSHFGKMLVLTLGIVAVTTSSFKWAEFFININAMTVRQGAKAARNTSWILWVKSIGLEGLERALISSILVYVGGRRIILPDTLIPSERFSLITHCADIFFSGVLLFFTWPNLECYIV